MLPDVASGGSDAIIERVVHRLPSSAFVAQVVAFWACWLLFLTVVTCVLCQICTAGKLQHGQGGLGARYWSCSPYT